MGDNDVTNADILKKLCSLTESMATKEQIELLCENAKQRAIIVDTRLDSNDKLVESLTNRVAQLEKDAAASHKSLVRFELSQQRLLSNNICIHGIPMASKDDPKKALAALCTALNVKLESNDCRKVYRGAPGADAPGVIVAHLASFTKKMEILNAKRTHKPKLCVRDLKLPTTDADREVFVNSQLTPYYAELLSACKKARTDNKVKSCWLASAGISVKLLDDSVVTVNSAADFVKATGQPLSTSTKSVGPSPFVKQPTKAQKAAEAKIAKDSKVTKQRSGAANPVTASKTETQRRRNEGRSDTHDAGRPVANSDIIHIDT